MHNRDLNALQFQKITVRTHENATPFYTVRYGALLGSATISTSTWTTNSSNLSITEKTRTNTTAVAKFTASHPGTYRTINQITDSDGEILERTIIIVFESNTKDISQQFYSGTPTPASSSDCVTYVSSFAGADPTGLEVSTSEFQNALDTGGNICIDGTYLIDDTLLIYKPINLFGSGHDSGIIVASTVGATTDIFELNPNLTEDKWQWIIHDFSIKEESGTPGRNVFAMDITTPNKFLAKLQIYNIWSNDIGGQFFELTNPVNTDGLFTSVFRDNWSKGGFSLIDVGDSVFFERNTISGAGIGVAYEIDQLGDASKLVVTGCNCTASGGLVHVRNARNLTIKENTIECNETFDGFNNAPISIDNDYAQVTFGTKIINNNINTQGNVASCIYLGASNGTLVDGNTLFCDDATDSHITLDTDSYNTVIGRSNTYQNTSAVMIDPIIVDNGVGTMGFLKDYTITLAGWALIDAVNNHPAQFIKDTDGIVTMFGAMAGPAAGVGATFFTLPLGFRPVRIVKIWTHDTAGTPYIIDILPGGQVQIPAGGATSIYLDGMSWYSKKVIV